MHDSLTIALLQAREAAMAYFRPIVKRHNLTEQQWRIVRILAERPSMDFHDLAFRACILRPSLTGILTRMERDGLVLRLKPVNDQRKLYVSLTPAGTALYESAQAEVEETYRLLEAQFTTEKLQQLTSLLEEFVRLASLPGAVMKKSSGYGSALGRARAISVSARAGASGSLGCGSGQPYNQRALAAQVRP